MLLMAWASKKVAGTARAQWPERAGNQWEIRKGHGPLWPFHRQQSGK
jgi:hypothetical protein